jgi:hypothetical protein
MVGVPRSPVALAEHQVVVLPRVACLRPQPELGLAMLVDEALKKPPPGE